VRRYLLDTGPLAAYLFNRPSVVQLVQPWLQTREVATSVLVYGEVAEYLAGRANAEVRKTQLRTLLQEIAPHFLTYRIMDRYAAIRRQLRPPYGAGLIGDVDTLIAATALDRDLTLVTMDRDFERVPNLKVRVLPRP
jgi:predicted nucleic acid-binding protein